MSSDTLPEFVTAKRLDSEALAKAAAYAFQRYIQGDSIRTISVATGWSYGKTHRLLGIAETPMRSRGGYHR